MSSSDEAKPQPSIELSLIIPAYNESAIITRNIGEVEAYMRTHLPEMTYEIVVVDDGSSDGMSRLITEYSATHPEVRLIQHNRNRGRGKAIRTGLEGSRGQYIICLDADLSYAPEHITRLLAPLQTDDADITLASAYHPGGSVANVPCTRAFFSKWGNRILSAGLKSDIHTVTCIVRGFRKDAIDAIELINDGKDLHLEIIQKAELFGLRLAEVPGHLKWRDRNRGRTSKKRLRDFIPLLSLSGTIASHLVYSYVLRPGTVLNIPVAGLLLTFVISALLLLWAWLERLLGPGSFGWGKLYFTLRETLLQGGLTFVVMVASLLVSIIFIAFYFASQQSKRHHDEVYILLSRMNARLKQLERSKTD